jgi:hypothetical protein
MLQICMRNVLASPRLRAALKGSSRPIVLKKSTSSQKWHSSGKIVSSGQLVMTRYYNGFDLHESIFRDETWRGLFQHNRPL